MALVVRGWILCSGIAVLGLFGCGSTAPDGAPSNAGATAQAGATAHAGGQNHAGASSGGGANAGGEGGDVAVAGAAGASGAGGAVTSSVTYWQDLVPIFQENCMMCHQTGGLGPDLFSTYMAAEAAGGVIKFAVQGREMPPWDALSDGSCGTFADDMTLTDQEIATITEWADGGRPEGTPVSIMLPAQPSLVGGTEYSTPTFTPMPEGTVLAQHDEYRCFSIDPALVTSGFITAYEVVPGIPAVIHHVLGFLVDPATASAVGGVTNGEQMQALDDQSPDRLGWPCFGMAGDGVEVKSVPVTWAPGQGVVSYPGNSGIQILPSDRIVVQVHYNLENENLIGREDTTLIRLQMVDTVERIGTFVLHDPLLESLSSLPPDTLAPGQASVSYNWQATLADFGLSGAQGLQLHGVMPHMHKLGHSYSMSFNDGATEQCGIQVPQWDIHWQRMYFYEMGIPLSSTASFDVTCDFDTSMETTEVFPGWGTANEMCLATLYFTSDAP